MARGVRLTLEQQAEICVSYQEGLSSPEIAKQFNITYSAVLGCVRRHNIPIRKGTRIYNYQAMTDAYIAGARVEDIAQEHHSSIGSVYKALTALNITIRPYPKGEENIQWKGGTYKDKAQYVIVGGDKKKRWHREFFQTIIGRKLEHWECVHHVDGNKTNNDITNLVGMPMKEHTRFHSFLRARGMEVSRINLELYTRKENEFYFRFSKADFNKYCDINKIARPKKIKLKCIEVNCENERYGKKKVCSKHYQRRRAAERGCWISGGGRKAKYMIDKGGQVSYAKGKSWKMIDGKKVYFDKLVALDEPILTIEEKKIKRSADTSARNIAMGIKPPSRKGIPSHLKGRTWKLVNGKRTYSTIMDIGIGLFSTQDSIHTMGFSECLNFFESFLFSSDLFGIFNNIWANCVPV